MYLYGPEGQRPGIATLLVLLILLQLLLVAKMKRTVVDMKNNFLYECLVLVVGHLAAMCGSALVTVALAPEDISFSPYIVQ